VAKRAMLLRGPAKAPAVFADKVAMIKQYIIKCA